jgi:hypothetical protein
MHVTPARCRWILPACLAAPFAAAIAVGPAPSAAQSRDSAAYSVPVVVSDFELYSTPPRTVKNGKPAALPPAKAKTKTEVPLIYQDTDAPLDQANRLVDFFAMALVQTLQTNGFQSARRGRTSAAGAQIRGVFAEPDALNRIRRSILGAGSPNGKFLLYVGVFNLGKPQRPLYELATEQPQTPEYGPVITLNNYVPLAKYELDKNPTEEDVRKICNQIAASLAGLLAANPMAFSPP